MTEGPPDWDDRYVRRDLPWDTGCASVELQRVLREYEIPRGRALELGCGTGTNAVFLSREGFEVTACDISPTAIEDARTKAAEAGVEVTLLAADLAALPDLGPPFGFVFDRGVYHTVRRDNVSGFVDTLSRVVAPGGMYLTLTGNANQVRPGEEGPPRITAEEICRELTPLLQLVQLREFHFTQPPGDVQPEPALAWSAFFRRG